MTTITRRKPASSSATNNSGIYPDSASNNLSQSNQDDRDKDDERDNDDDKDTRLTLMEEVLLLGLKDREVCERFFFSIENTVLFFSGLYIILERLYFIGFTWLYFN